MSYQGFIVEKENGTAVVSINMPPANTYNFEVMKELDAIKEITRTRDCHEGIRAFLEKRDPVFRGPYYDNWPFGKGDDD